MFLIFNAYHLTFLLEFYWRQLQLLGRGFYIPVMEWSAFLMASENQMSSENLDIKSSLSTTMTRHFMLYQLSLCTVMSSFQTPFENRSFCMD